MYLQELFEHFDLNYSILCRCHIIDLKISESLNTYNLYQITSANNITISSKRLYKNNFENTVYKNYNNSQITRCKIWDIV